LKAAVVTGAVAAWTAGLAQAAVGSRRKRACILVWLGGGPSQLDTFDPKPDAPAEVRGPTGAIATAVPGLSFSEHLPCLARRAGRLRVLRPPPPPEADPERAVSLAQPGNRQVATVEYPSLGAAVARAWAAPTDLPGFVAVGGSLGLGVLGSGFLGVGYE